MKLSNLIIGIILFTTIVTSGGIIINNAQSINPEFMDVNAFRTFNRVFNQQTAINQTVEKLKESMVHKDPSIWDGVTLIYNTAIFAVNSVWSSIQFIFSTFWDIPTVFGFDNELAPFIWALVAILTVVIIFAVLSATLYREM